MGVYIKGMEMPNKKNGAVLIIYPDGKCAFEDGKTYQAVSVPEHGRLIDADALEQNAQERMLICNQNDNQFQKPYEVMRAIALAPTIIPAEEG